MALGLLFSTTGYAKAESETVGFDIPAPTLPQALRAFARQSCVELVFAERGFDDVRTQAIIGPFPSVYALEMLRAGTGLQVGYGPGAGVIAQRAHTSDTTSDPVLDGGPLIELLAQVPVDESPRDVGDTGAWRELDNQSRVRISRRIDGGKLGAFEEIIATGSCIRGAQSAFPVITIDRANIDTAGFATLEEVVEYFPQNFGAGVLQVGTKSDRQSFLRQHRLPRSALPSVHGFSSCCFIRALLPVEMNTARETTRCCLSMQNCSIQTNMPRSISPMTPSNSKSSRPTEVAAANPPESPARAVENVK